MTATFQHLSILKVRILKPLGLNLPKCCHNDAREANFDLNVLLNILIDVLRECVTTEIRIRPADGVCPVGHVDIGCLLRDYNYLSCTWGEVDSVEVIELA